MKTKSRSEAVITAGIDAGSLTTDAVLLVDEEIAAWVVVPTGESAPTAASTAYQAVLRSAGLEPREIGSVVSTGYGRASVDVADRTVTEITCHALGARRLFPEAAGVIDIGGQDSKAIRLASDGRVEDFVMNDRCAAGTGRFLEVMAQALGTEVQSLGELSALSTADVSINSTCTVFAESEVVALVSRGVPREDIIRGLHRSVAERIYTMVARLRAEPPFVMSGGVAKNPGVVCALEHRLGTRLLIPQEPQIVGALGAAIVAQREVRKSRR